MVNDGKEINHYENAIKLREKLLPIVKKNLELKTLFDPKAELKKIIKENKNILNPFKTVIEASIISDAKVVDHKLTHGLVKKNKKPTQRNPIGVVK